MRPAWSAIEAEADGSFFLSWSWIGTWLETTGVRPYVLTAQHRDRPVAMALLHARATARHAILPVNQLSLHETGDGAADSLTIEYNGILVTRAAPPDTPDRCLAFLAGARLTNQRHRDWDELYLSGVPADYLDRVPAPPLHTVIKARRPCLGVDLDALRASGADYLDRLSASTRRQIRRALHLYAARGPLEGRAAASPDEALSFLAALQDLHDPYWRERGQPGAFASAVFADFHRRLIATAWPKGEVELYRVTVDGGAIGYLYNFVHRGMVHNYLSGFAYESDNRLKPGLVTHCLCLQDHLRRNHRLYDLMAGDSRYKRSLASPHQELVWCVLQRRRPLLRLEAALRGLKHGLDALTGSRSDRG